MSSAAASGSSERASSTDSIFGGSGVGATTVGGASAASAKPVGTEVSVSVCESDVLLDEAALDLLLPRPTIWLSSGSVLNGQVGSGFAVEGCLRRLVRRLRSGGHLLVSGWSCSFLYPELLAAVGLEIAHVASLPSAEADGLESDLQRLQLFVLRKGEGGEEPLSEKGGEKEESEEPLGQRAVSVRVWAEDSPLLRAIAGVNV